MAISSFTGNLANTIAKINEASAANGWGITAATSGSPSNNTLAISDADNHVLMAVTGIANEASSSYHGVLFYYNNGTSNKGYSSGNGSGTKTATLYITSHGFIIINNSYNSANGICAAWININDDGTVIYGGTATTSTGSSIYNHLIGCKYDETTYQNLAFTPHTNPSGTTLCSATAVGSLGEPQVAKYMFYAPVYQSALTGEIEVDGERYVAYGGMWYLKD